MQIDTFGAFLLGFFENRDNFGGILSFVQNVVGNEIAEFEEVFAGLAVVSEGTSLIPASISPWLDHQRCRRFSVISESAFNASLY